MLHTKFGKATDTLGELLLIYVAFLLISAGVFSFAEGKTYIDSLWWACVTATTIGYGDIFPVTLTGRIVGVVLYHVVIFVIVPLTTARLASTMIVNNDVFDHHEQEQMKGDIADIKALLEKR